MANTLEKMPVFFTSAQEVADYVMMIHKGELLFQENKDEMLYRYGIVRGSKEQIDLIPMELIAGKEESGFGCSALVKDKERLVDCGFMERAMAVDESSPVIDRAGLEDILLFIAKTLEG